MIKKITVLLYLATLILLCSSCEKVFEFCFGMATQPQSQKLTLPKNSAGIFKIDNKTFTVLVFKNGKIYVYKGLNISDKVIVRCNTRNSLLTDMLTFGKNNFGREFKVVIKPSEDLEYKNIIEILDEMIINKIKNYSLEDMKPHEKLMKSFAQ